MLISRVVLQSVHMTTMIGKERKSDFERKLQYADELIEKYGLEGAIKVHCIRILISLGIVLIVGCVISIIISVILVEILGAVCI